MATNTICRGCGLWMSEHAKSPPCPPYPPGFSAQHPPPWPLSYAWKNVCERAERALATAFAMETEAAAAPTMAEKLRESVRHLNDECDCAHVSECAEAIQALIREGARAAEGGR